MSLWQGLKICYPLDSNSNDLQGGYDGADTSISYSAGKVGNCAVFNGSSSCIDCGRITAIENLDSFSVSLWVNISSSPSNTYNNLFFLSDNADRFVRITFTATGYFQVGLQDVALSNYVNMRYVSTSSYFSVGTWVHIAATYTAPTWTLYINGSSVTGSVWGSSVEVSTPTGSNSKLILGSDYAKTGSFFDGKIDQVCVWDRVLTSTEASALYNSGNGIAWPLGGFVIGEISTTESVTGRGYQNPLPVGEISTTESVTGAPCSRLAQLLYLAYDGTISKVVDGAGPYASWQKSNNDYEYYTSSYAMASDNSGNLYGIFADMSKWYVAKINPSGVRQWEFEVTSGTPLDITCDVDGDYVYVSNNYISGMITKIDGSTGTEITTGNWPITSATLSGNAMKKIAIGRDGNLYAAINSTSTYGGKLYKFDPDDGSKTWDYTFLDVLSSPIIVNDFDVNASGVVAVGCVDNEVGHGLWKLTALGAKSWSQNPNTLDTSGYGEEVHSVAIDDDGYVYYSNSDYGFKTAKLSSDGTTEQWSIASYGYIHLSSDGDYLYRIGASEVGGHTQKFSASTGTEIFSIDYFSHIAISNAEIPAWDIIPTIGANGSITTNIGFELSDGENFAVAVDDSVTLSVDGDTGYAPASILLDDVEQL